MEVIVQMGIGPANGDDAMLAVKGSVVDVGWPPEISTGRHVAKLHHPGSPPDVVDLLTTIVVGNVVLLETGSHTKEKGVGFGMQVVFEQLQHATRCHRGNDPGAGHPVDVFGGIDDRQPVPLRQRVVLIRGDETGFTVVVKHDHDSTLADFHRRHGNAWGNEEVIPFAVVCVAVGDGTGDDEHFQLGVTHPGRQFVTAFKFYFE